MRTPLLLAGAVALCTACDLAGREAERGLSLARAGDLDHAAEAFESALKRDPDQLKALFNLGLLRLANGEKATAAFHLRHFVQLRPEDARGRFELARALVALGIYDDALEQLRESVRLGFSDYAALTSGDFQAVQTELGFVQLQLTVAQRAGVAPRGGAIQVSRSSIENPPLTVPGMHAPGVHPDSCEAAAALDAGR